MSLKKLEEVLHRVAAASIGNQDVHDLITEAVADVDKHVKKAAKNAASPPPVSAVTDEAEGGTEDAKP